jgi:SOS-response transcriptional repressor LexA/DNA-binding XRE family transcriptional regulator
MPRHSRLGNLIREYREKRGLTQGQLAQYAQVPRPWLSVVETGRIEKPERDRLTAVAKVLRIDPERFLDAAGYNITPGQATHEMSTADLARELLARLEVEAEVKPVLVPIVPNVTVSAGAGGVGNEVVAYLPKAEAREHEFLAVRVIGDCMEPDIHRGEVVVVDTSADPRAGDIVVAEREGEMLIKRLRRRGADLFLEPNQSDYETVQVDEHTRIVGVVRWSGREH